MNKPPIPVNFYFISSLFFLMIWAISPHTHAKINSFPLSNYEAEYNIEWHGLKAGTSIHRLMQNSDDTYTVESRTLPRFGWVPVHFVEKSKFSWQNSNIKPLIYQYDLKEARKHKKGEVNFDYQQKMVSNTIGQEPWQQAMPQDIQDKLTHTLKLRAQLMNESDLPLEFTVAEDDEIKPYHFTVHGNERIKTKLGWLETIKLSHTSRSGKTFTMWLAKNFEYAPVKVEQSKNGSVFATGEIISYRKL